EPFCEPRRGSAATQKVIHRGDAEDAENNRNKRQLLHFFVDIPQFLVWGALDRFASFAPSRLINSVHREGAKDAKNSSSEQAFDDFDAGHGAGGVIRPANTVPVSLILCLSSVPEAPLRSQASVAG